MMIRTSYLIILAVAISLAACASSSKDNAAVDQSAPVARADSMKALSLRIVSPVQAGRPYPAVMTCTLPAAGVELSGGHFFWNQEGPFDYPVHKFNIIQDKAHGRCVQLEFMLFTGRPSTYTISGYVNYRDKASGLDGTTEKVSAGAVRVR